MGGAEACRDPFHHSQTGEESVRPAERRTGARMLGTEHFHRADGNHEAPLLESPI